MKNEKAKDILEAVVIIIVLLALVISYNNLVKLRNKVDEQAAQIENVLQGRIEKIPDLVKSAKALMEHEETVFTAIAEARKNMDNALGTNNMEQLAVAEEQLNKAISDFYVVVEAYPELKSDTIFIMLSDEIAGSVNRIQQERRTYNLVVTQYNNQLKTFPTILFAKLLKFEPAEYFQASTEAHQTNVVDFDS